MTKNFNSIHEETELIFVYGSLKRGFHNEGLLYNAKSLGKAKTVKKYPLVITKNPHYPYLVKEEGKGYEIIGELYRVRRDELEKLDQFEGKEFKREKIKNNRNLLKRKTHNSSKIQIDELDVNVYYYNGKLDYTNDDISWAWNKKIN